jgi:hypothetical protein
MAKQDQQQGADANLKVTLCERCGFRGTEAELGLGSYNSNEMKIRNKSLSSLKIPDGVKVTLFEQPSFKGRSIDFFTDNSCLMRATPLVFCNIGDALRDCRQTHCHLVCEDAVSIYVQILKNCLTTKIQSNYDNNLATAISTKSEKIRETNIFASTRECKALIENVLKRKERILDMNKSDVLTTLYCGLNAYAFFDTFESAMEWLFSYHIDNKLGLGDSDSNAAIMGAIIGAKIGLRAMLQETKTNFNYNIVSTIKTNRPIDYQPSMRLNYLLQELTKLLRYG